MLPPCIILPSSAPRRASSHQIATPADNPSPILFLVAASTNGNLADYEAPHRFQGVPTKALVSLTRRSKGAKEQPSKERLACGIALWGPRGSTV
jgi:hypothetical protein